MHKIVNMHDWVSELPEDIGQEVIRRCVTRSLVDGECLYRQGDPADACFRVISGKLKMCNFNHYGQELLHTYLMEGDCVGDPNLILDEPRLNFTFAVGETRVAVLRPADFHELYGSYPEIARAINRVMARRIRFLFMLAEDASLLPLRQRLARAIVRMGYSVGQVNADGSASIDHISHEELSKMVGATRQSVGRELKKLEHEGSILIEYGKLTIHDIAAFGAQFDRLLGIEPVVPEYQQKSGQETDD